MKKKLILLPLIALCLTGCGIEKEYKMTIKSDIIAAKTKINDNEVSLLHCTRSLSAYNYYIAVDADEYDEEINELTAKHTNKETKYIIIVDGKSKTVSDHGYKFISWEN
jgi:hypothetical protein